jgi:hypothetical protein
MSAQTPTLIFFRKTPSRWRDIPELISSLQSWETTLLLFGLRRFPASLVTIVSAIESLLKPHFPELEWVREDKLKRMLSGASKRYNWHFAESDLKRLRIKRNDFIHEGFIPKDNAESIDLLFRIALPFIANCFSDIHSFDLIDGMVAPYSDNIRFAQKAYSELRKAGADKTHCADALVHLLQLTLQNSFLTNTMIEAMSRDNFESAVWETMHKRKESFIHRHGTSWDKPHFDCPVCEHPESILCELDEEYLFDDGIISPKRLLCSHCDFSVGDFSKEAVLQAYEPILCKILLQKQIQNMKKEEIISFLSEFGSDGASAIAKLRNT